MSKLSLTEQLAAANKIIAEQQARIEKLLIGRNERDAHIKQLDAHILSITEVASALNHTKPAKPTRPAYVPTAEQTAMADRMAAAKAAAIKNGCGVKV